MIIKARDLLYGQKFKLNTDPKKGYFFLKHKKPFGTDSIALYTKTTTLIIDEDDLVTITEDKTNYKGGSWICECLCINPIAIRRCMNRECRATFTVKQRNEYVTVSRNMKRVEYLRDYTKKRKSVDKNIDL